MVRGWEGRGGGEERKGKGFMMVGDLGTSIGDGGFFFFHGERMMEVTWIKER